MTDPTALGNPAKDMDQMLELDSIFGNLGASSRPRFAAERLSAY